MAAPGTLTHVLEVARHLTAAVAVHAATLEQAAAGAAPPLIPEAESTPAAVPR